MKKLKINRESIRTLGDVELRAAHGGVINRSDNIYVCASTPTVCGGCYTQFTCDTNANGCTATSY